MCVCVLWQLPLCGNSILAHSIIQILCLYVARANLCSCSCSRVLKTLHQLYTRHLAAAPGWVLQWAGNVFIMIAGSPEIRFVDSPCCLAWLVAVAVVVVVVGSAYERGNLLISTAPPHTLRMSDGWIHINWQFIYTKRHHYQRPRRSHTFLHAHTHCSSLCLPQSPSLCSSSVLWKIDCDLCNYVNKIFTWPQRQQQQQQLIALDTCHIMYAPLNVAVLRID